MRGTSHRWMMAAALALCIFNFPKPATAQFPVPAAFEKAVPNTLQDLHDIEAHVQKLVQKVMPATVGLRIGQGQGSGVVIDRNGYILTAGHVSGPPNHDAVIVLSDGTKVKGKTLGANVSIDSGMVVLTEKVDLPFLLMARSSEIKRGQWCLSLGHPGGYKPGRVPVTRLGRVLEVNDHVIVTDCTLVGGDSGGPLFDMRGRVMGIHSRIGNTVSANLHVPVDTYRDTWHRLAAGEVWGTPLFVASPKSEQAYLGLKAAADKSSLKIQSITPGSPAERAGLLTNDTILRIDQYRFDSVEDLGLFLKSKRPGTQIMVQVSRGKSTMSVPVILGKRTS